LTIFEIIKDKKIAKEINAGNITAAVASITPEIALHWLKNHNIQNRPMKNPHSEQIRRKILKGEWGLNGQPIILGKSGRLLDGQNRLFAILNSGKTVQSMVVWNIDDIYFKTIDLGKPRTGADVLYSMGYSKKLASPLSTCAKHELTFRVTSNLSGISDSNLDKIEPYHISYEVQENELLQTACEYILEYGSSMLPIKAGGLSFLLYRFMLFDYDKALEWMDGFITGANLDRNDSRLWVRERLYKESLSTLMNYNIVTKMGFIIKSWHSITNNYVIAKKTLFNNSDKYIKLLVTEDERIKKNKISKIKKKKEEVISKKHNIIDLNHKTKIA